MVTMTNVFCICTLDDGNFMPFSEGMLLCGWTSQFQDNTTMTEILQGYSVHHLQILFKVPQPGGKSVPRTLSYTKTYRFTAMLHPTSKQKNTQDCTSVPPPQPISSLQTSWPGDTRCHSAEWILDLWQYRSSRLPLT
jgi:hypothetical protein